MVDNNNYGALVREKDLKLQRTYFMEMCRLLGIKVIYKAPLSNLHYSQYTEVVSNYHEPILVSCIFQEHPNTWTTKKLGWVSELQENDAIIYVPYDLQDLQVGALFIVPSPYDETQGRVFRVVKMSASSFIYPASIACHIVPEYENTFEKNQLDIQTNDFTLLLDESEIEDMEEEEKEV